jgi:hypothetical protein
MLCEDLSWKGATHMPKTQKDIGCASNSDSNTVTEPKTSKNAGTAVNDALGVAKAAARREQLAFKNLHCPPNDAKDTRECTKKDNEKGDAEDIIPAVSSVTFDQKTKEWTAIATATWSASFDCVVPAKK